MKKAFLICFLLLITKSFSNDVKSIEMLQNSCFKDNAKDCYALAKFFRTDGKYHDYYEVLSYANLYYLKTSCEQEDKFACKDYKNVKNSLIKRITNGTSSYTEYYDYAYAIRDCRYFSFSGERLGYADLEKNYCVQSIWDGGMGEESAENAAIYRKELKKRCELSKDIKYCFAYAINLNPGEDEKEKIYKKLCDKNDFIPACAKLADIYLPNLVVHGKNFQETYLYLKKACDGKDAESCAKLAYISAYRYSYKEGFDSLGIKPEYFHFEDLACEYGNIDSCERLSDLYKTTNLIKALEYKQQAKAIEDKNCKLGKEALGDYWDMWLWHNCDDK